jgi:hypothetical protein
VYLKVSSRGLVVKAGDHFSCTIHGSKNWKLTWYCCIGCNPAKGRVNFEDGWLIKSSFKDQMKACQLTRTKVPHKKTAAYLFKKVNLRKIKIYKFVNIIIKI